MKPKLKKIDNIECWQVLLEESFATFYKIKYRFAHSVVVMLPHSCMEIIFTQEPVCACVVVHSLSCVWLFVIPWTAAHQAPPSFAISWYLLKFMFIESVTPSNHLIFYCPLLLLPSVFPSIRVFLVTQLFTSGGQSIRASASTSVLLMNIQGWFPLGWTDWISLLSKGLSRVFSSTTTQKHQFFGTQLSLWSNSHIHTWLLEKQ